ncbi:MAG: hypothetical protein PHV23_01855 [Candidatus Gracilibacteria bacterium]|nr:hypothetical protein [Candidatus Gracilibacteria bacterium]
MNKKLGLGVAIIILLFGVIFGFNYISNENKEVVTNQEIESSNLDTIETDHESNVESESDTMTADECYDDEYFDEQDQWCYANEVTDESEDFIGEEEDSNFEDFGDSDGLKNLEAVYEINGDSLTLMSGVEDPTHKEIWSLYTKAIPSYFRENVKYFNVTNEPENSVDASVFRDSNNPLDWHIHVNRASYFDEKGNLDKAKVHTLIHEFTHVMTLGDDQIDEASDDFDDAMLAEFKDSCKTFYLDEGCLEKGSYLEKFMTKFWSKDDIAKSAELGGAESFNKEGAESLYTGRDTEFVTEYAATSSVEDIAESFGFFVLSPKPTGATIADQKMLFFYNYPNLVKVRDVIRNRLK